MATELAGLTLSGTHTTILSNSDTAVHTQGQGESSSSDTNNADIIDCLSVLPPYSETISEERTVQRHRTESLEHIINFDDDVDQNTKVCCTMWSCKVCLAECLTFKRLLVMLATAGVLSVATGIVLGASRLPEYGYISLSIMFSVLGILLLTVVIIGWRCTPPDNEPCHLLFGLGSYSMVQQRFLRGQHRRRSRFYWIGGRLFPEFRYRRPPPTYTASMQDHQQSVNNLRMRGLIPQTPPPTYKLHSSQRTRERSRRNDAIFSRDGDCSPPVYEIEAAGVNVEEPDATLVQQEGGGAHSNQAFNHHFEELVHPHLGSSNQNSEIILTASGLSARGDNSGELSIVVDNNKTAEIVAEVKSKNSIPADPADNSRHFYDMLGEVTHL